MRHKTGRQLTRRSTWLQLSHFKSDVDMAVNANVILYLGENERTPAACKELTKIIIENSEGNASKFYSDTLAFYYILSRAYFYGARSLEQAAALVPERIARRQKTDGSFGNALRTALAACSLLNCGQAEAAGLREAVRHIAATQAADGSWPRAALYSGPNKVAWFGSEELTTAFCVEALARYRNTALG
jgi:hypothetical protein